MFQKKKLLFPFLFLFLIILITASACQLPFQQQVAITQAPDMEATIEALQTEMVDVPVETDVPAVKVTVTNTQPSEIKQPDSENSERYQGFYVFQEGSFKAYDFSGQSLGVEFPAGMSNWYGDNQVNTFTDEVFYAEFSSNPGVFRVNAQGTQKLDFIESMDPVYIAVSPDRQQISWSTSSWGEGNLKSEIFVANTDGSNQQLIASIVADTQNDPGLVYFPVQWTDDGRLIYATGMTGIGGYMIFWGYNGLYIFNPLNNSIRTLVDDQERLGICLSSISDDLTMIAIVCGAENHVRVRNLESNMETIYPIIADQVLAGSARFSPSGEWLAYVVQRADPMQELGKVVVVPVDGSQSPQVVATVEDGSFVVEGWSSENYILVSQSNMTTGQNSVIRVARDGSEVTQLAAGTFMNFIP